MNETEEHDVEGTEAPDLWEELEQLDEQQAAEISRLHATVRVLQIEVRASPAGVAGVLDVTERRPMFDVHILNENGIAKAKALEVVFRGALEQIEAIATSEHSAREVAIVRTKLQEASFFAKRAMALDPANQKTE